MGALGLQVPETRGGLGMNEVDMVLLLEECGRAALPEPFAETAAVAAPLLASLNDCAEAQSILSAIAQGSAIVTPSHEINPFVSDAHIADFVLLSRGDEIHLLKRDQIEAELQESSDPCRKLFKLRWTPAVGSRVAAGQQGRSLSDDMLNRAALAVAAQQLGVATRLTDMAVAYACEREQFGKAIGSFQAVKHQLANVAVRVEFARPVVARAAFCVATEAAERSVAVSHAKIAACEAATAAAKTALQVHGAIGYTWEVDLQIWMKRAWALDKTWGASRVHQARIAAALLGGEAAPSFGFSV